MSLKHDLPFYTISLRRLCLETKGVRTKMKIKGEGTIRRDALRERDETFVLVETTLCQDPGDIHAVRVPKGMVFGETVTIYSDDLGYDFVRMDFDEGKNTSISITGNNDTSLVCRKSLLYKMVQAHFELVQVDGEVI